MFLVVATGAFAADAVSKGGALVAAPMWNTPANDPGNIHLALAFNGFGPGGSLPATFWFPLAAGLLVGYVSVAAVRTREGDRPRQVALGLIAGGTLGNLINHLLVPGGVIDFIGLRVGADRWLIFNGADVLVLVGVVGFLSLAWVRDSDAPWWRRGVRHLA